MSVRQKDRYGQLSNGINRQAAFREKETATGYAKGPCRDCWRVGKHDKRNRTWQDEPFNRLAEQDVHTNRSRRLVE